MKDNLDLMIAEELLPVIKTHLYPPDKLVGRLTWLVVLRDSLTEALRLVEVELERLRKTTE